MIKCPDCGSNHCFFLARGCADSPQKVRCNICSRLGTLLEFDPPKSRSLPSVPSTSRILLLSIHPQHAASMLNGFKTVEVRRVRPRVSYGDVLLFYVTAPVQALKIMAKVEKVVVSKPAELWEESVGIDRAEFDTYFEGIDRGCAIHLREIRQITPSVPLSVLRDKGVAPPQLYRFLTRKEFASLRIRL